MGLAWSGGSMNVFWAFLINGKGGLGWFYFPLLLMIGLVGFWVRVGVGVGFGPSLVLFLFFVKLMFHG